MLIIITGRARSSAHQNKQTIHDTQCGKELVCACWSDKCLVDPSFKRCPRCPTKEKAQKNKGGEPRMNGYGHPPDRTRHLFFFTSATTQHQLSHTAPYIKQTFTWQSKIFTCWLHVCREDSWEWIRKPARLGWIGCNMPAMKTIGRRW